MARRRMRMAELVRESNVPRETIHFYLREGLLPPPEKAGRTLAYYDDAHLERLRFVRHLRDEKYLPIPVIRSILNAGLSGSRSRDALTLADVLSIDPAIGRMEAPTPDDETLRVALELGLEVPASAFPCEERGLPPGASREACVALLSRTLLGVRADPAAYAAPMLEALATSIGELELFVNPNVLTPPLDPRPNARTAKRIFALALAAATSRSA